MLKFGPKNCDKIDALLARAVKFNKRNGYIFDAAF